MKASFKSELKRQFRLAVTAAIGFIIAWTWKDAIVSLISSLTQKITGVNSPIPLASLSALTTTLLGVILILITSKILEE